MTTTFRPLPTILLLGLALIAVACSGSGSTTSPTAPGASAAASPAASPPASGGGVGMVDATGDWRLSSGTNAGAPIPIVPDADITLTVAGSQVSGRSACNQYGGEIVVKDGQVQFGPLMMTEMACAEPIMASEAAYAAALAGVRAATRDGDRLTLTGDGVELVFERVVPAPEAELVDTDWILDSIIARDAVSSVMGEPASLRLAADGTLSGSTGCRTFMGRYTLAADMLTIADLATDRRACADDLVNQDEHVLAVLGGPLQVVVHGQQLTLTGQDGGGLGYVTREPEIPPAP